MHLFSKGQNILEHTGKGSPWGSCYPNWLCHMEGRTREGGQVSLPLLPGSVSGGCQGRPGTNLARGSHCKSVPASWAHDQCSHTGPCAQRAPCLGLNALQSLVEILDNVFPAFVVCQ